MQIVIASKNKGKIREIKAFFKDLADIEWLTFEDFKDFPNVKEDGKSFKENAELKAKEISLYTNKIALADDSGLEVDALGGRPGIRSARYEGLNSTDKDNRDKLIVELEGKDRKARFVCSMILWNPRKGSIFSTSGICNGHIGRSERGSQGFGYDPIFLPDVSNGRTMAEINQRGKNKISHRGKALKLLYNYLAAKEVL